MYQHCMLTLLWRRNNISSWFFPFFHCYILNIHWQTLSYFSCVNNYRWFAELGLSFPIRARETASGSVVSLPCRCRLGGLWCLHRGWNLLEATHQQLPNTWFYFELWVLKLWYFFSIFIRKFMIIDDDPCKNLYFQRLSRHVASLLGEEYLLEEETINTWWHLVCAWSSQWISLASYIRSQMQSPCYSFG